VSSSAEGRYEFRACWFLCIGIQSASSLTIPYSYRFVFFGLIGLTKVDEVNHE
jgi:hypothetical protein